MSRSITELASDCFDIASKHGFWVRPFVDMKHDDPVFKSNKIALMHSELSECLEAIRKPHADKYVPEMSAEVVELADCIIRILDYCHAYKLDIEKAINAKMEINRNRPFMHGKTI